MLKSASLQDKLQSFITQNLEKELWLAIRDNIPAAYRKAYSIANDELKLIPKSRILPQLRRYCLDDAILGLCLSVVPELKWAGKKCEHYVVLNSEEISLSYASVNHGQKKPRKAKHRDVLALKNAGFEPVQEDWIGKAEPELEQDQSLHIVVIAKNPQKTCEEQNIPSEIFVTIPFIDWTGFHLYLPLAEIIRSYDNRAVEVYDGAWPQLKKEVQKAEEETTKERKTE